MRLGVSNLLWPPALDPAVATVLADAGVERIDLAPSRYFAASPIVDGGQVAAVRDAWAARGIAITGLQSLLYDGALPGEPLPSLFGDQAAFGVLDRILRQRIDQAARLGASVLVFGSWPNRRRGELGADRALAIAARRFLPLAEAAATAGVTLAIEPIHAGYGNDFLVDHDEAAALVAAVDHPAFALVLDVGCAGLAGEDLAAVLTRHGPAIRHIQLAEQGLAPLSDSDWHRQAGPILSRWLARRTRDGLTEPGVCIEALSPPGSDPVDLVRRSIEVARRWYS